MQKKPKKKIVRLVLLLWSLMQILLKNVSNIKIFIIFFYKSTDPLIFFPLLATQIVKLLA